MSRLTKQDRLVILKLTADIASEAAHNPNVVWTIEFQEKLVETLYRKMTAMVASDLEEAEEEDEDWDDDEEEEAEEQAAASALDAAKKKEKGKDKKGKKGV